MSLTVSESQYSARRISNAASDDRNASDDGALMESGIFRCAICGMDFSV